MGHPVLYELQPVWSHRSQEGTRTAEALPRCLSPSLHWQQSRDPGRRLLQLAPIPVLRQSAPRAAGTAPAPPPLPLERILAMDCARDGFSATMSTVLIFGRSGAEPRGRAGAAGARRLPRLRGQSPAQPARSGARRHPQPRGRGARPGPLLPERQPHSAAATEPPPAQEPPPAPLRPAGLGRAPRLRERPWPRHCRVTAPEGAGGSSGLRRRGRARDTEV